MSNGEPPNQAAASRHGRARHAVPLPTADCSFGEADRFVDPPGGRPYNASHPVGEATPVNLSSSFFDYPDQETEHEPEEQAFLSGLSADQWAKVAAATDIRHF